MNERLEIAARILPALLRDRYDGFDSGLGPWELRVARSALAFADALIKLDQETRFPPEIGHGG